MSRLGNVKTLRGPPQIASNYVALLTVGSPNRSHALRNMILFLASAINLGSARFGLS